MAESEAMMAAPMMKAPEAEHGLSMSDAMDMCDEHGLTKENFKDVIAAAEMVYGEEDKDTGEMEAGGEQAMLDQAYASDRGR